MRPELMNALAVAYLGDAVFEVYVREYLLTEKGIMKLKRRSGRKSPSVSGNYRWLGYWNYQEL